MMKYKLLFLALAFSLISAFRGTPVASNEIPKSIEEIQLHGSLRKLVLLREDTSVVLLTGMNGILLIDDGAKDAMPELKNRLEALKTGPVRYIILTHWHPDHAQGVQLIGRETTVVSHPYTREMLSQDQLLQGTTIKAQDADRLPHIAVTSTSTLHFDGEVIEVVPLPGGHTGGDLVVYFRNSNVLHVGDLVFSDTFPFCDMDHGGNILRMVENIGKLIDTFPENTRIIPTHGREYGMADMRKYNEMLKSVVRIVSDGLKKGQSSGEMKDAKLLTDFRAWAGGVSCDAMIDSVFRSLNATNEQETGGTLWQRGDGP